MRQHAGVFVLALLSITTLGGYPPSAHGSPPVSARPAVVAFGDSITWGSNASVNRLPTYMRPIRPVALEEAAEIAIEGMIEHLQGRYRASRAEAIALAGIGPIFGSPRS